MKIKHTHTKTKTTLVYIRDNLREKDNVGNVAFERGRQTKMERGGGGTDRKEYYLNVEIYIY